ncbi:hypothetical protein [Methylobacillus sp.]|uniref:hypothetical protein n=1 Tax=Methylobacillus sp. TaxID=56818 RepID=UPI0012D12095|nr:hypothetical protein [Methylobacillus sp.]MPS48570.1 hypothetical protein [Methylobacillus sp.]
MKYDIKALYAVHEGGTKFYQIIQIVELNSGRSVCVTNWGKYTNGCKREPRLHKGGGGVKVDMFDKPSGSMRAVTNQKRAKTRNGYIDWREEVAHLSSAEELRVWGGNFYDAGDLELIQEHLNDGGGTLAVNAPPVPDMTKFLDFAQKYLANPKEPLSKFIAMNPDDPQLAVSREGLLDYVVEMQTSTIGGPIYERAFPLGADTEFYLADTSGLTTPSAILNRSGGASLGNEVMIGRILKVVRIAYLKEREHQTVAERAESAENARKERAVKEQEDARRREIERRELLQREEAARNASNPMWGAF